MKKYLFITLFALSLSGFAQITSKECNTQRSAKGITLTINCKADKAALIISNEIKARQNTEFFDKNGDPCLVVVYSDGSYEVTGADPEKVLLTTTKISEVRKFAKSIILNNL